MSTRKNKKKNKAAKDKPVSAFADDRHALYEASVQLPEGNLLFMEQTFKKTFGRAAKDLREDFCGTARLACEWVSWDDAHRAWGVDLDAATMTWGKNIHLAELGEAADRVTLVKGNVLRAETPAVDMACAFNFSYFIFKKRTELAAYFRRAHAGLRSSGMLVLDLFGGHKAGVVGVEKRSVRGKAGPDGLPLPKFTYAWDQADFNPLNHHLLCYIHFKLKNGQRIKKAFRYDWRLWSIPELRDLLLEAGFNRVAVYTHGWEDNGTSDDVYKQAESFNNEQTWLAYVVGIKE